MLPHPGSQQTSAIVEQIDKYLNFKETLEKEKSFSFVLINRFVQAIAQRTAELANLTYDEAFLKSKIVVSMQDEFEDVCKNIRKLPEIADNLFLVLNTESISKLDGVDGQLKQAFNNIYCNPKLDQVGRQAFFSQLVQKYEAFLKKLYYLINNKELEGREGKAATLADAIHAFRCLWDLKYDATDTGKRFASYLQMLRDWRNEEAHNAPTSNEEEINAGIKVSVAMYLYVVAFSITDLEMAGY